MGHLLRAPTLAATVGNTQHCRGKRPGAAGAPTCAGASQRRAFLTTWPPQSGPPATEPRGGPQVSALGAKVRRGPQGRGGPSWRASSRRTWSPKDRTGCSIFRTRSDLLPGDIPLVPPAAPQGFRGRVGVVRAQPRPAGRRAVEGAEPRAVVHPEAAPPCACRSSSSDTTWGPGPRPGAAALTSALTSPPSADVSRGSGSPERQRRMPRTSRISSHLQRYECSGLRRL